VAEATSALFTFLWGTVIEYLPAGMSVMLVLLLLWTPKIGQARATLLCAASSGIEIHRQGLQRFSDSTSQRRGEGACRQRAAGVQ